MVRNKWTNKLPTEPGWWWYRDVDNNLRPRLKWVWSKKGSWVVDEAGVLLSLYDGEWSTYPVLEPKEADDGENS